MNYFLNKINAMKTKKFIRSNPHLPVRDLKETLDYYRDVLGFYDEWHWINKDGKITDGGIRRNDMRLLFAEDPDFTNAINNKSHRLPLMWFVDNIEDIYAEFQDRDIEIADALKTHPYGLREFAFIDINDYYIRIAEQTE
jgi:catechol 2,3-dioxygenase-like lactoylglutathione lyase family enzyme